MHPLQRLLLIVVAACVFPQCTALAQETVKFQCLASPCACLKWKPISAQPIVGFNGDKLKWYSDAYVSSDYAPRYCFRRVVEFGAKERSPIHWPPGGISIATEGDSGCIVACSESAGPDKGQIPNPIPGWMDSGYREKNVYVAAPAWGPTRGWDRLEKPDVQSIEKVVSEFGLTTIVHGNLGGQQIHLEIRTRPVGKGIEIRIDNKSDTAFDEIAVAFPFGVAVSKEAPLSRGVRLPRGERIEANFEVPRQIVLRTVPLTIRQRGMPFANFAVEVPMALPGY